MSEKRESVVFLNVPQSYPPGEKLSITYRWQSDLKRTSRDWIGLFRVGWQSSRDYYTFEWAPATTDDKCEGSVTFVGRRLPPEDGHFYQLCYVSRDGTVRGASAPFQFLPPATSIGVLDELELVEVSDSIMVLQHKNKEVEQLRQNCKDTKEELSSIQASHAALAEEKEALKVNHETVINERDALRQACTALLAEKETIKGEADVLKKQLTTRDDQMHELEQNLVREGEHIKEIEHQIQVVRESEQRVMEKLDRERAHNKQLQEANLSENTLVQSLQKQLEDQETKMATVVWENGELQKQIKIKESQVEDLQLLASARNEEIEQLHVEIEELHAKLEESNQRILEVSAANEELSAANEALNANKEELEKEVGEWRGLINGQDTQVAEKQTQIDQLQQDVSIAQENIAELAGANELLRQQLQQSGRQLERENLVDKSVYEALHSAYETMEGYYRKSSQENKHLHEQLQQSQEVVQTLEGKCDELMTRIEQGKKEFEVKAGECVDLRRQLKGGSGGGVEVADLQKRVRELESEQDQMINSCEEAVRELTARREEAKLQQTRISDLEMQVAQLQSDYEQLEEKHDEKIHQKNEALDRQQEVLDEKLAELLAVKQEKSEQEDLLRKTMAETNQLEAKIQQYKAQLQQLKKTATEENVRACPVCNTKFPGRMHQQEFERHVAGHFQD